MLKLVKENFYVVLAIILLVLIIWQLPQALSKDCEVQKAKYDSFVKNESVLKQK